MLKKKIALIVNPIAGIGGRVGLKGSDGDKIVKKAFELGAIAEAQNKARLALSRLLTKKDELIIYTYPGPMGENISLQLGFETFVKGKLQGDTTSAKDTEQAAIDLSDEEPDLLLFAGGDGTARNIFNIIGKDLTVIGIPAGVKIHSAVYADTPIHAGDLALLYLFGQRKIPLKEAEVMDIDEEAIRNDMMSARLYGLMLVPDQRNLMQSAKAGSSPTERESMISIASHIVSEMGKDICYFIGPGTTMRAVMETLGLQKTLLGVDAVMNGQLLASDLNENQILQLIDSLPADLSGQIKAKIVVTVIGGQGYVFGRGNQQLSHRVISRIGKENIIIGASEGKILALDGKPLLADSGSTELDQILDGYVKVVTSLNRQIAYRLKGASIS